MNDKIKVSAVFDKQLTGTSAKNGKPYNMLKITNGFESVMFSTDLPDLNVTFKRGDSIDVTMAVNPFDEFRTFKVVAVEKSK